MTRPVYEPSPGRKDSYLDWSQQQLFRRPAVAGPTGPPGTSAPIEWIAAESTTNWLAADAAAGTQLEYTLIDGPYDTAIPTFDIINGDLAIAKDGFYIMSHYPYNSNRGANGEEISELWVWSLNTSGQQPESWHPWSGTGSIWQAQVPDMIVLPSANLAASRWHPAWTDHFGFQDGSFPGTGPCVLATYGRHLADNIGVNDSDVIVRTTIIRLGSVWSA